MSLFVGSCQTCPHDTGRCNARPATREDVLLASGLVSTCPTCGGKGHIGSDKRWPLTGYIKNFDPCPDCRGGLILNPEAIERAGLPIAVALADATALLTGQPVAVEFIDDGMKAIASQALWAALDTGDTE